MELSHEQRIVACEQLAEDMKMKGWTTKVWKSTSGPNPGVGVEVRKEPDGDVWASITVAKGGFLTVQKYSEELSKKQIETLCDDATYPGDEPLRPSQQYTKILPQDEMNGGGRASALMQRLGFADTKTAAVHAAKNPVTAMPKRRKPGEDEGAPF